jgi:hypothetical protein
MAMLAGCGGMSAESAKKVENAARTSAAAYRYEGAADADTPAAALILTTHCSLEAVIRDEKLQPFDSGAPCP